MPQRQAANVRDRIVFSWEPNPAVLATEGWNSETVRKGLREHVAKALDGGCHPEVIMKDTSTVRCQPRRLRDCARIASEVTGEFA